MYTLIKQHQFTIRTRTFTRKTDFLIYHSIYSSFLDQHILVSGNLEKSLKFDLKSDRKVAELYLTEAMGNGETLNTDRIFHDLMGKKTEARYEFLMANAGQADNLDV